MDDRTTILYPRTGAERDTGFGLPDDLLQKSRRRIRVVGLLVVLGAGLDLVLSVTDVVRQLTAGLQPGTVASLMPLFANVLSVAIGLGLAIASSTARVGSRLLLQLALVAEVVLCFVISVTNPASFYALGHVLPYMTWVTPLIVLFPLIVPCPPGRTLVTAIAAAAMRPLGIFILAGSGAIVAGPGDYAAAMFSPTIAVVFAYIGSRVVYGLGLEVAEARRMGSYELVRKLGAGGMGEVWLARHRLLARPAAVKLIRPALLGAGTGPGANAVERFEREAQATASMRSPHTIEVFDFGVTHDGTFYYVMELLEGYDADSLVRRFGPVPAGRAVGLLQAMCHSLAEAHEAGLIHRDIKPANVFVCRYGRDVDFVKVLDFGLVRRTGGGAEPGVTAEHTITGTPAFMAPEQALGSDRGDARSDLYAVGCVAYWLLTGRLVFEGETPIEVLTHHARTPPVPPSARTDAPVPAELDRLVLSCLEKDPARRPQDAVTLSRMLGAGGAPAWSGDAARAWWTAHPPDPIV